jgi:hypothetical protein
MPFTKYDVDPAHIEAMRLAFRKVCDALRIYDDLVDHCCEAWNKLTDQPWRIMSIGLRQWAHGF